MNPYEFRGVMNRYELAHDPRLPDHWSTHRHIQPEKSEISLNLQTHITYHEHNMT